MSQSDKNENITSDLFAAHYFDEMFEAAIESHQQIQLHTNILKDFSKLLTLEAIKDLVRQDKILQFLDVLVNFLQIEGNLHKKEKKAFLNGCENMLFLQSLMFDRYEHAVCLNEYRIEKSINPNKKFLFNRIKAGQYSVVENLLDFSTDVTFDASKILKLMYVNLCRDYDLFKRLIEKHGFDINAHGDLGLEVPFEGTFVHLIALMIDEEAVKFFANFVQDYGQNIDFDLELHDVRRETKINLLNMILNNEKMPPKEKLSRVSLLLSNSNMNEEHVDYLAKMLLSESAIASFYTHPVYDALFSHQSFNSNRFDREFWLNKIIEFDNSEKVLKIREKTNNRINPVGMILDKFFRFVSPFDLTGEHPVLAWVKLNKDNKIFCASTIEALGKYYKPELNEIGLLDIKMSQELLHVLKGVGLFVPEKKGLLSKLFTSKEEHANIALAKRTPPKVIEPTFKNNQNTKPVASSPTKKEDEKTNANVEFTLSNELVKSIKDEDIKQHVEYIKVNVDQFNSLEMGSPDDINYMNVQIPKFVTTTLENYKKAIAENPSEAKKHALIQLNMFNNKTFEILSKNLESDMEKV